MSEPSSLAKIAEVRRVFVALCDDAADRAKFYASMGPNFERIMAEALNAAWADGFESAKAVVIAMEWGDTIRNQSAEVP